MNPSGLIAGKIILALTGVGAVGMGVYYGGKYVKANIEGWKAKAKAKWQEFGWYLNPLNWLKKKPDDLGVVPQVSNGTSQPNSTTAVIPYVPPRPTQTQAAQNFATVAQAVTQPWTQLVTSGTGLASQLIAQKPISNLLTTTIQAAASRPPITTTLANAGKNISNAWENSKTNAVLDKWGAGLSGLFKKK